MSLNTQANEEYKDEHMNHFFEDNNKSILIHIVIYFYLPLIEKIILLIIHLSGVKIQIKFMVLPLKFSMNFGFWYYIPCDRR